MNKSLSKNLQDIDYRDKNVKFSVCKVEIYGSAYEKKLILRKRPLEICIVIEIY